MHNFLYGFMWGLGFFLAGLVICGICLIIGILLIK